MKRSRATDGKLPDMVATACMDRSHELPVDEPPANLADLVAWKLKRQAGPIENPTFWDGPGSPLLTDDEAAALERMAIEDAADA